MIAVDVGNNAYSFGRYFECTRQAVLMSGYLGSIGFGYPAAMGAWAATRGARPICAVTGDGGFAQYMAELLTAVKHDMDITHVLLNNGQLGKISKEQRAGEWAVWQTSLHNPDFSQYAELCGALGIRVTDARAARRGARAGVRARGPGARRGHDRRRSRVGATAMDAPSFSGLLIVVAVAFAVPFALGLLPRVKLPAVVLEIVLGIVIGPAVLGWVQIDTTISVIALIGLVFLLFLAGLEIEFEHLRGRVLKLAGLAWVVSFAHRRGHRLRAGGGRPRADAAARRRDPLGDLAGRDHPGAQGRRRDRHAVRPARRRGRARSPTSARSSCSRCSSRGRAAARRRRCS